MKPWNLLAYMELMNSPAMQWSCESRSSASKVCMMCGALYEEGQRVPDLRLCCIVGKYKSYNLSPNKSWLVNVILNEEMPEFSERQIEHWLNYMDLVHDDTHKPP